MALGRIGGPGDGDCVLATATKDGVLHAVLHFVPWGADGLSLDLMRRDRSAQPGLNDFLIAEAITAAPALGAKRVSLNFAVFRAALEPGERIGAGPVLRAWRSLLLFASRWYQIQSLYKFNAKFGPVWEPRFFVFPGARAAHRAGRAPGSRNGNWSPKASWQERQPQHQSPQDDPQYWQGRYQPERHRPGPAQPHGQSPGSGDELPPGPGGRRSRRHRKHGRVRRLVQRPAVRVVLGVVLVFCCWVCLSVGQALAVDNGLSLAGKLAEWGRDHYLGSAVTMLEQLTYSPPKTGGKPQFSLTGPRGKLTYKHVHGFRADIPANLTPFARPALPGEGAWRLAESVHGQPAVFTTFLRVDAVHTSYVAGIASFDQRLVRFQLHPGAQDPGTGFGGGQPWIPPADRTGLLATFNGGFRLSASRGGFYLNGATSGTLTSGAASVVFYRNGTIKIGAWGRDVTMTPDVAGVRQNLKLIVDHGRVAADINRDVETNFGATLGGAYAVWRSGLGITRDGRVIYVYGPALTAQSLADLLQRAGAVEAMELDINPFWTTFEYYQARGHPADPAPVVLLPDQQTSAYRYYSPYSRDFTAVYAR